jgi:hypothetical protein
LLFTPTEAAVVALFYALLISVVICKKLDIRSLGMSLLNAGIKSSYIFLIIATAIYLHYTVVLAVITYFPGIHFGCRGRWASKQKGVDRADHCHFQTTWKSATTSSWGSLIFKK